MKKLLTLTAMLTLTTSLAFAETLELSTYYPAPSNVLAQMRLFPSPELTGACRVGTMYVNESGQLRFCRDEGLGIENGTWGDPPGVWTQSGDNLFPTDANNTNLAIGIGTSTPESKLDVNGDLYLSDQRPVFFTRGDNKTSHKGGFSFLTYNNGVDTIFNPTDENGNFIDSSLRLGGMGHFNNNQVNLYTSGKVGIGTHSWWSNPTRSKFGLIDTNVVRTQINMGSNVNDNNPVGGWQNDHGIYVTGRDFVGAIFNSDGKTHANFAAAGVAFSEARKTKTLIAYGMGNLTFKNYDANENMQFITQNGLKAIIHDAGSTALTVKGQVKANGYAYASDGRFKKNISKIPDALRKILNLRGVEFEWNTSDFKDKGFDEGKKVGFIAQEVEEILPEVVSMDTEGYRSVDYMNVVALLVEAVKEQQKEIELLKQQLK